MPRPERVFRTQAIILRRMDYGEADRLLTLLTPDHGKLRCIAKGCRKPLGKLMGHVELYSRAVMLLSHGRDLYNVTQAEQVEPYLPLREDLARGAYAHYVCELLDRFSEFEEINRSMFNLLSDALGWLSAPEADLALATRYFEMRLLSLAGFQPSCFECAVGHEALEPQEQYFSVHDGGVVCPNHVRGRAVIPLSLTGLKLLRYMQTRRFDAVARVKVDAPAHQELERILQGYTNHLLEMQPRSAEFIRTLRRRENL